jgi:hypothetical protein
MLIFVHHTKSVALENVEWSHLQDLAVRGNDGGGEASREMFCSFSTKFQS